MTKQQGQLQAWDRFHGWHDVLEDPQEQEYGKCVHCEKPMTKLEAEQSEMGNEDWDNLTCDECFDKITLQIAKGAFPSVFSKEREIEFKLAHGVLMTRDEWLVARKLDGNDATSDKGYKEYASEI